MSAITFLSRHGFDFPAERISAFCRRWRIRRLDVFGSVLRDDFRPDSDVDLMYALQPGVAGNLDDLLAMEAELAAMVGRKVDLVDRQAVEGSANDIRRRHILATAEPLYVEG